MCDDVKKLSKNPEIYFPSDSEEKYLVLKLEIQKDEKRGGEVNAECGMVNAEW